jgi:hypothetical protein
LFAGSPGHYFLHTRTLWPEEADADTQMITHEEARCIYENLSNKRITVSEAFDGWKKAGPKGVNSARDLNLQEKPGSGLTKS